MVDKIMNVILSTRVDVVIAPTNRVFTNVFCKPAERRGHVPYEKQDVPPIPTTSQKTSHPIGMAGFYW
jgi:hypothetical protein